MRIRVLSIAFLQLIAFAALGAEEPALSVIERDGILASLLVQQQTSEVHWRFLKAPADRLVEVSATVNERPLETSSPQASPAPEAPSLTLLLLDLTDPHREAQILRDKFALLKIAGQGDAQHNVAIAVYAKEPELLVPKDGTIGTLVNMVAAAKQRESPVDLDHVLYAAMNIVSSAPAHRRAIYLLTDGHSDSSLNPDPLVLRARASGISLTFILTASGRPVEEALLEKIANDTGGLVIRDDADRNSFMQDSFQLLESGNTVVFSHASARQFFWERDATQKVELQYEGGRIEFVSHAEITSASVWETVTYVWEHYRLGVVLMLAGVMLVVLLCVIAAVVVRKRKNNSIVRVATKPETQSPSAAAPVRVPKGEQREHQEPERVLSCEEMWDLLQKTLRQRGTLPLQHEGLTPAEIANHVRNVTSDGRAQAFVQGYYYPHIYGKAQGDLSDAEALKLVDSLTK